MWKKVSEHSSAGILARSSRAEAAKIDEEFNFGIFFSSYESRALLSSFLFKTNALSKSMIVLFNEKDELGLRARHDKELYKQVVRCSKTEPKVISGSVHDIHVMLKKIFGCMPRPILDKKSKWFIDISGAPKPYTLGILAQLHRKVSAPQLCFFHPSGDYDKADDKSKAFAFTSGFNKYIWIPGYEGQPKASLLWNYIFLLGFEGERSYGTFYRFEPDRVMALIGNPGYKKRYRLIAEERNMTFLSEARPRPLLEANAGDAVQAWQVLEKAIMQHANHFNNCIVPLGTKPHALGGGLASLSLRTPGVMYIMPRSWVYRDIPAGRFLWRYDIAL